MAGAKVVKFGPFTVTSQVFYQTSLSYALVNLKPLLPGHVLVCPKRVVPRLKDLSSEEVTDLFLTVQKVGKVVERVFRGESLNIAIQDGTSAGQSVPHVHTHIIPRRTSDLPNSDDIYSLIESDAGDLGKIFREQHTEKEKKPSTPEAVAASINEELVLDNAGIATSIAAEGASLSVTGRPKFPTPPADHLRKPRTVVEMEKEARTLARFMEAVDGEGS